MSNNASLSSSTSIDDSELLNTINNLNDQDFKVIAEASIVYLYDIDKLERLNTLNQSLSQVENCKEISKWTMKHVSNTIKQKLEISKLNKHYQANLGLNETKSIILKELFEKHLVSLKDKLDNQNLMISQLVDMEWKFGVTASTNTIDKLGNAFLQLKLHYNRGDRVETSFMELTLPQFYSFLHEMNKAKSQMDYLS